MLNKLPATAQIAHRSPGISNNLLAASELVDAGCEIFFHSTGCEVTHNGEIILRGWRDPTTRLWRVSLIPDGGNTIFPPYSTIDDLYETPDNIQALSAYQPIYECTNTNQLINFYHATMGYPVVSTWCKAIDKGYFRGWNGLTSDRVRKFIRPSSPSEQGHMDQRRAYIRSTTQSPNTPSTTTDHMTAHPQAPNNDKTNVVYMSTIEVDGQLFTDQTGRFPVTSNRGNNYIRTPQSIHRSLSILPNTWPSPQLHRLDNETSKDVENFITDNNATFQYTPPDMHRTNIAERAIRTWKNHLVAIRTGTPRTYRLSNWCKDLEQTDITLNMLRPCTTNPLLSAYKAVEGMFSFNRTPMAPIGTKEMVPVKPNRRQTWGYHAIRAWYFAPARHHYRCIQVVTEAGAIRVSDTFRFLHNNLPIPTITNTDRITKATQHLIRAIEGHHGTTDDELQAIQNLRDLITGAASSLNNTPPSTESISTIIKETATSITPTLTNLVSPDPSPQPLQSATPTRVPNQPTVIPFEEHEYTPSDPPTPRYNLRSQSNIVLSAIAMIGEAQARGMTVAAVIDNDTGDSLEYRHLIKHPKYKEIWSRSYANELGRLTDGIRDIPGTKTMQYIRKSDIPKNRLKSVAYSKIVVVERPQKKEKERTRLTVVGTYIDYPGNTAVPTSDLTTAKLLFNSVISTDGATFHGGDLKNFYLNTPMDRPEYMRLKYDLIPQEIKDKYKLDTFNEDGWIYVRIDLGMYGLPQAGILANKLLEKRLAKAGYYQCQHTPGLWRHVWRPITFCLVVDDFASKPSV
eukprot:CCRYP_000255-RA/>CCRYP_000255-RA protein AED:0.25 eAED:0.25 QI:0/0/0/1/1/1/2/0/796